MNIKISQLAIEKIRFFVDNCDKEISGLGIVEEIPEKELFYISDVFLLDQEVSHVETTLDAAAIAQLTHDLHKAGKLTATKKLKFWFHSHVNMSCQWSSTDDEAIAQLTEFGYFISTVFNKKGDSRTCYGSPTGHTTRVGRFPIFMDDLHLDIETAYEEQHDIWLQEIKDKVREPVKTFEYSNYKGKDFPDYSSYNKHREASFKFDDINQDISMESLFTVTDKATLLDLGFTAKDIENFDELCYDIIDVRNYLKSGLTPSDISHLANDDANIERGLQCTN